MRPMTHGEIRGSLLLLFIMIVAVLSIYISNNTPSRESASSQHSETTTLSTREIDSLSLEERAKSYISDSDSTSNHRNSESSKKSDKSKRKSKRQTSKQTPTPSPLDRPIRQ